MNIRGWVGSLFWVVGFNLCVALIAVDWGIGWAVGILCLRHIMMGIPHVYHSWRKLIVGSQKALTLPELSVDWPNRKWIIETVACVFLSLIFIIWFNSPLGELLFSR